MSNSSDNPHTQEIILSLVAKITELDAEVMKSTSTRIGILSDLADIESRVSLLEEQSVVIRNKFNQQQFPTLVEEFVAHEKKVQKLSVKRAASRKKL